jgi:GNAT superfamily N-acetyltransferase
MTDQEARELVLANPAEFGCTHLIRKDVDGDNAQVLHSPVGFVIVRPLGAKTIQMGPTPLASGFEPSLAWLWIDPSHRGQGHGQRLIREVLRRHGHHSDVVAGCYGADRLRLFRRCGFTIDESDGDWHRLRWRNNSLLAAMLRG